MLDLNVGYDISSVVNSLVGVRQSAYTVILNTVKKSRPQKEFRHFCFYCCNAFTVCVYLFYGYAVEPNLSFGTPAIQGTPLFRGNKIWSLKNVNIIFVSVTSTGGIFLFKEKGPFFWVPQLKGTHQHSKSDRPQKALTSIGGVHPSQWRLC